MWTKEQTVSKILREIRDHEYNLKKEAIKYYSHLGFKEEDFDPVYKKFLKMTTQEKINHMKFCDTHIDYDKRKGWTDDEVKNLVIYLFCSGAVGYEYLKSIGEL